MKFRARVKNDRSEWWEDFDKADAIDQGSAEECGRKIIENYNATLYPGDLPRTLLEVQMGGDGKRAHDWQKTNLVTVMGRGGSNYDTLRCRACGCEARRYGLSSVQRIGKWKAAKWDICNPNSVLCVKTVCEETANKELSPSLTVSPKDTDALLAIIRKHVEKIPCHDCRSVPCWYCELKRLIASGH